MNTELQRIARNNVREKLARDEVVASMTVRLVSGIEIVRIAQTAGFDTIYIDLEHSSFSLETTGQICMAALAIGIAPFVRVPTHGPEYVSRVLDCGALGVIAPHVRSVDEARNVVRAAKFSPIGERSASGGLPHLHFRSFPAAEANAAMNDATMVIVQFESKEAIERAESILAVDGVDMALLGINDYLSDLGLTGQYDHPAVEDAYSRAIAAARKHGKHVGVGGLASRPDLVAKYVKMGARYVSTGTDLGFLIAACAQKAKQVHDIAR